MLSMASRKSAMLSMASRKCAMLSMASRKRRSSVRGGGRPPQQPPERRDAGLLQFGSEEEFVRRIDACLRSPTHKPVAESCLSWLASELRGHLIERRKYKEAAAAAEVAQAVALCPGALFRRIKEIGGGVPEETTRLWSSQYGAGGIPSPCGTKAGTVVQKRRKPKPGERARYVIVQGIMEKYRIPAAVYRAMRGRDEASGDVAIMAMLPALRRVPALTPWLQSLETSTRSADDPLVALARKVNS